MASGRAISACGVHRNQPAAARRAGDDVLQRQGHGGAVHQARQERDRLDADSTRLRPSTGRTVRSHPATASATTRDVFGCMPWPTPSAPSSGRWPCPRRWNTGRRPPGAGSRSGSAPRSCATTAISLSSRPTPPSQDPCSPRSCTSLTGCGQHLCRHDGALSGSIQAARRDRCAPRKPGCALGAGNDHWAGFPIAISAR